MELPMKKRFRIILNAPVVIVFVAICFLATVSNMITGGAMNRILFMTYRSSFSSPMTYIRLFTHVFGHGNWEHLIGNMTYILLLGPMLEEKYRSKTLMFVILITALVTGGLNLLFFPNAALCGASGVVFAFIVMSSFTGFKEGEIPITFLLVAVFFIGQQVIQGLFIMDNVSNMSHIAGGILGGFLGYSTNKKQYPERKSGK